MSIISAYVPTARAPPEVKSRFLEDLEDVADGVPYSDFLVLPQDDLWRGVVGKYGIEERNCPDEDFLQFCKHNRLTAMKTCFQKKLIRYGTWMHPTTKLHHNYAYD